MASGIDLSGTRIVADGNLLSAYAEASGYPLSGIISAFGVSRYTEPTTCTMSYHERIFGYKCSSCGRITRSSGGERFNFCPQCGAEVRG